ncbi:MAG: DUF5916 domain-containing protein [Mucilaginibacter sp.]
MKLTILICSLFLAGAVFAQDTVKKTIAIKTTNPPKIDGLLDDDAWKNAPIATDFVEFSPVSGKHESNENRTEVKILYDDDAIYVGARMYETTSKVAHELVNRDNVGTSDFVGVVLDCYHDGINAVGFYVTAAGVQFDAKYAPNPNGNTEDPTWNAVWLSKAHIDKQGWTAEIKIPYSALRFAKKDVQFWGIQLVRRRQYLQKELFWNAVDPKKNGFVNQEGDLTGIQHITPPVRLGFYPYISTYLNHYPYNTPGLKNTSMQFDGGMDVKYGINESFTLDLTLVPDFGQVQSDNKVLNLTPFEVKYVENRPFFTEGTELFTKGNIFYSRRVGGQPINYSEAYNNLKPGEQVISNPTETKLLNAFKITGRTAGGLGVGIFNAVTDPTDAVIQDSLGNKRLLRTSPYTNYNILVLDQNLANNSSVTLINTNVDRFGKDYSADVGGMVFSLYNNKANTYTLRGFALMSNLYGYHDGTKPSTGYSYEWNAGKASGNFTWILTEDHVDDKYNPNDLGILNNNNYFDHNLNLAYANYKPKHWFTQWDVFGNMYYSRRYYPSVYQLFQQVLGFDFKLKNFSYIGLNFKHDDRGNDFYEPRVAGRWYQAPEDMNYGIYYNNNPSARFSWGGNYFYRRYYSHGGYGHDIVAFYTLRVNDHFSFGQNVSYMPRINNMGYSTVDSTSNNPIFALRNVHTLENIFNIKYTFNDVMGFTFRLRHYWSKLNVLQYYDLNQDGSLGPLTSTHFSTDNNMNYNDWNIDMLYVWEISPGSELSFDWKNSSLIDNDQARQSYFQNFENTLHVPKNNNFSLKILYYIDYQSLVKKHRRA